jgi:hypothetical protein
VPAALVVRLTALRASPAWASPVVLLHATGRRQLLAGYAGQHRDPGRSAPGPACGSTWSPAEWHPRRHRPRRRASSQAGERHAPPSGHAVLTSDDAGIAKVSQNLMLVHV